ncbi:uncharacterized protein TOT_040000602 [Theileria orientalis strain Shintoku]|uniref:26 proteasome complex subunit DSS1 n=1 Tax=Theileria orientalis strain Shintoku TaxID=869250 RepID=J4CE41_THEOR|nr:uncharacterized protein TOT_040000602 [Theileria orientalis strain Shintoku]PVC51463.1 hypothetical protein MACL_00001539 [Theileria orientalis]BAM42232.1 uncharacterized protein TOT_040000602 [Theileria orientalis strain Shintoku]|eukprot:XP_009692533.1 uncharacterized protein TOT_040000602 [Theileria orientalis strain Shintoku]
MDQPATEATKEGENGDASNFPSHFQLFDEPDDELEEFDEIESIVNVEDPEIADWNEDWEKDGWDDEDAESDFVNKILQELENYKKSYIQQ